MTWNYQLMKHTTKNGEVWFAIHEYYRTQDGNSYTENPIELTSDSKENMLEMLEMIKKDIETEGIIDYDE